MCAMRQTSADALQSYDIKGISTPLNGHQCQLAQIHVTINISIIVIKHTHLIGRFMMSEFPRPPLGLLRLIAALLGTTFLPDKPLVEAV